jgi:hypothetical protein
VELTPMAIAAGRRLSDRLFGGMKDAKVSVRIFFFFACLIHTLYSLEIITIMLLTHSFNRCFFSTKKFQPLSLVIRPLGPLA